MVDSKVNDCPVHRIFIDNGLFFNLMSSYHIMRYVIIGVQIKLYNKQIYSNGHKQMMNKEGYAC